MGHLHHTERHARAVDVCTDRVRADREAQPRDAHRPGKQVPRSHVRTLDRGPRGKASHPLCSRLFTNWMEIVEADVPLSEPSGMR